MSSIGYIICLDKFGIIIILILLNYLCLDRLFRRIS